MSKNSESNKLSFTPEIRKMNSLSDMKEIQISKYPSCSQFGLSGNSKVLQERPYWTTGRKGLWGKISDKEFGNKVITRKASDDTINEIQTILSNMNLSKYLKGSKRSLRSSPEKDNSYDDFQVTSNSATFPKKAFLVNIPPPPKTKSLISDETSSIKEYSLDLRPLKSKAPKRQVNSKLKELTERLRPVSAPPSPKRKQNNHVPSSAPPASNFSFFNEYQPIHKLELSSNVATPTDCGDSIVFMGKCINTSKLLKKNKLNNLEYATLPRTKAVGNRQEPRTLASLDLNINYESPRNISPSNNNFDNYYGDVLSRSCSKQRDKRETDKDLITNENICYSKMDARSDEESSNAPSSRRGSLKQNVSNRKGDFDLNFSKFGSLISSKNERRRSINKKSKCILDQTNKSDTKTVQYISDGSQEQKSVKSGSQWGEEVIGNETISDTNKPSANNAISNQSNCFENNHNSISNPLEKEIRAIAKLLDGKESIFLKLIQSSNLHNRSTDDESESTSIKSPDTFEVPEDDDYPEKYKRDQNSPTRVRAMTVPVTETDRNCNFVCNRKSPPPQQKRFYKKRLRGPYGEMLEHQMRQPAHKSRPSYTQDLDFLKELESLEPKPKSKPFLRSSSHSLDETHTVVVESTVPKRKTSANIPLESNGNSDCLRVPSVIVNGTMSEPTLHIRSHSDSVKTSSTWNADFMSSKIFKHSTDQSSFWGKPDHINNSNLFSCARHAVKVVSPP